MSVDKKFPSLSSVIGAQLSKTAGTVSDPGPDSSHPASVGDDNLSVSEGPTITDDEKKNEAARGDLAADGAGESVEDKPGVSMNTEVGKDGDELSSELKINDGVKDPGPDSDHPASLPTEKFASCETAQDIATIIQAELKNISNQFVEVAKLAGMPSGDDSAPATKDSKLKNPEEVPESDDEADVPIENKVAAWLDELAPDVDGEDGNPRVKVASFLHNRLEPYVADGIRRATNLATYIKLASTDPAAAEAMMMGADPAAGGDPMMGGDPAAAGGAMPPEAMMGGDPAAAASLTGDPELDAAIMEIAQQTGMAPEEILAALEAEPAAGGEAPPEEVPPMAAPEEAAPPPEEAPAEGPPKEASATKEAGMSGSGDSKQKAVTDDKTSLTQARRKIADLLLQEHGQTPSELARGVTAPVA